MAPNIQTILERLSKLFTLGLELILVFTPSNIFRESASENRIITPVFKLWSVLQQKLRTCPWAGLFVFCLGNIC